MQLTHLSLTDFRNYARLDIDVPSGPIMLVGGNAQGKTSLLEAVYYLATFVSFQATHDRQLVNFLAERQPVAVARINARYSHSTPSPNADTPLTKSTILDEHVMEVRLILQPNEYNNSSRLRKEILIDGVKRKTTEAIGNFNAVLFLPHMLRIVEGAPEDRRRYLNLLMVQVLPQFAKTLTEYNRTLTQRNALLKQLAERGGDAGQLEYWDDQLAALGAQVIHARIQTVQALERLAAGIHNDISRGKEILRLAYQPAYEPLSSKPNQYELPLDSPLDRSGLGIESIQNGFREELIKLQREEIARGVTTIGPHRDELRLLGNGIDLGTFGSRGQARTAILALKLAEVAWMKDKTGQWPVLLLDEVLAELDPQRRIDLLSRLAASEQAMMTTTDLDLFNQDFLHSATHWQVHAGQLKSSNL